MKKKGQQASKNRKLVHWMMMGLFFGGGRWLEDKSVFVSLRGEGSS